MKQNFTVRQGALDGVEAFLSVAQHRSFRRAAAELGVTPSAISQAVRALEARVGAVLGPLDYAARRRYGLDALYAGLYRGILLGFSRLIGWIDRYLVDGVLNALTALTLRAGDSLRHIQSGRAQDYVYGVAFGVLLLFVCAQLWRR